MPATRFRSFVGMARHRVVPALLVAAAMVGGAPRLATAQSSEIANPNPAVEARLKGLAHELRCLVCQNQTIADSDAPLAVDLRKQIRGMIASGKTDDDIRAYMVERYGNFVLYKPPFSAATALLWAGPFLLLLIGVAVMVRLLRRRAPAPAAQATPSRQADLDRLLGDEPTRR